MWVCHVTIILSLIWKDTTSQEMPGYSIQIHNVTVQEGLCVTIPCRFTAANRSTFTNATGYWKISYPETIVASNNKSVTGVKRNFHLTGNPDTGDCSLTITDARKEDNGTYHFRFEESPTSAVRYSYKSPTSMVTVRVTGRTRSRKAEISNPGTLISGREVTFTCSPPGNCSGVSPVFQWTKSNQIGIWKSSANVTFTPSQSDHSQSITCNVSFPAAKSSAQRTINLDVHYPPLNPDVFISSSEGRRVEASQSVTINERETLTLNCTVNSNPAATVRWIKGEANVDLNGTTGAEVVTITSSEADTYRCFVWNIYGVTEKRVQVISEQVNPWVTTDEDKGQDLDKSNTLNEPTDPNIGALKSTIRDLMIGIMCGMGLVLAVLLMKKIIENKQMPKNPKTDPIEEPPTDDHSQLYANIRKFRQQPKIKQTSIQVDTSNITPDEDLNYSKICFPAEPLGASLSQPETEYAQIKPKQVD